ncbi:MerC domain-containing protein [Bremerella sp. T1]|uniref:MerC domain-containing protein n=1 Tax=Bremerella sp. TYQ1 TaxID=3119568 RepID=UPI001CCFEBF7|nr:MerC domain-containing protein [Bremerella volcania]UBM34846.1 MerC domain-containing protein [Bremerella volcania]
MSNVEIESAVIPQDSNWRDYAGITASVACAIHCAAMPMVIGFLPMLGLSFLADESFHQWMAGICFMFAVAAFIPGWRKHRSWLPAAIGVGGLVVITGTAFGLSDECCASCSVPQHNTVAVEQCEAEALPPCCASGGCSEEATEKRTPVLTAGLGGFITEHAAWWTPLGGLLLVAAHLLNRHYACQCECCEPGSDT